MAAAKEGNPPEPTGPTLSQMFSSAGLFFNTSHLKRSLNETYNVFRKLGKQYLSTSSLGGGGGGADFETLKMLKKNLYDVWGGFL